jgi:uncharacterized protein YidB (DUF937 family)
MTYLNSDLDDLGDAMRAATTADLAGGPQSARATSAGGRSKLLRRPRVLAGSSLGAAAVAAGAVLAFGGSAGTSPAFAVTQTSSGVQVTLADYSSGGTIESLNQKLAQMGTGEQVTIYMARGAAPSDGPVSCTQAAGTTGPAIKVLLGTNGTEVIKPGESAGNTAEGTFHLASCTASAAGSSGNSGAA